MKEIMIKRYHMLWALIISFGMLVISSLFSWDENPIMGLDKVCADIMIVYVRF